MEDYRFELGDDFDESAQEVMEAVYAQLQWHNGSQKMKKDQGIMGQGGFFLNQREQRKATVLPKWPIETITFDKGDEEKGPAITKARIAVIRSRRCWQEKIDDQVVYFNWNNYKKGRTGKQQWLIAVEGCSEIFCISIKGTNGQAAQNAIGEHLKKIVVPGRKMAKKNLPPYAFWLTMGGGEYVEVGTSPNSKIVTPPRLIVPATIGDKFVHDQFVGKDNLAAFQQVFRESEEWAARWKTLTVAKESVADEVSESDNPDDYYPPADDDVDPRVALRSEIERIRREAHDAGISGAGIQAEFRRQSVGKPAVADMTTDQLSELAEGLAMWLNRKAPAKKSDGLGF